MLCRALYLIFIDISLSQVTLPEHTPPGSTVVIVTATDRDSGENGKITYSVMSSTQDGFYIDPNNGSLHSFIHCLARVLKEDDRSFITFGNHHCLILFFCCHHPGTLFINHRAEFDPERPSVTIVIEARDGGSPLLSSLTTVQVQISDVNDNAPVFHQSEYRSACSSSCLRVSTSALVVTRFILIFLQSYRF